ncbi:glutamine synthetase family protein [Ferruginibacter albus]|uniref:glutamine synthetase family protein n=1 Tax=Ferruginibacter albus TaxID=2875540 RepID=UPI001CC78CC0|nr:glutamine synthetase family protein [Ferruginibacter albus]UAY52658.1 glutamine synthetase family protein [Ferruginibacter albus]
MTEKEIIEIIESSESNHIKVAVTDIDGVLRGKIINKQKFFKAVKDGFGFCNVIFGWDINDACYDESDVSGWHTGYPDSIATIDLNTLRHVPWNENIPFFLADFSNAKDVNVACPRTLLKKIKQQADDAGYATLFAKEFEWFNFKETPQSLYEKNFTNLQPLTPGMFGYSLLRTSQYQSFYNDIFNLLRRFHVPLEGLHTETGPGVYEAAIEYTDALEAADRAVLFKTAVKEIAYRHELVATFMAKWNSSLPGCSGHIHQNLLSVNGEENLFYDEKEKDGISKLMQHYIAGQLYCLPFIMPMYAPTTNSYKRYVEGAWASTSISWAIENRTTALRVINQTPMHTRLETRVPGADANPYLSIAASLASGLYGIKNKLPLTIAATKGNEYENTHSQKLPKTLQEATTAMKDSPVAKELFGEAFVNHFILTREWECKQVVESEPNAELKRYFEIV